MSVPNTSVNISDASGLEMFSNAAAISWQKIYLFFDMKKHFHLNNVVKTFSEMPNDFQNSLISEYLRL